MIFGGIRLGEVTLRAGEEVSFPSSNFFSCLRRVTFFRD